jgi:hypothetical protein
MKQRQRSFSSCPNCGYNFLIGDNFCSKCGQENHDFNLPVKHLAGELLESTIHFDSKSFQTVKALLIKPGFLTTQFNSGKRKSYVPPIRLYIFVSFIFFLILNFTWQEYKNPDDKAQKNKFKLSFQFFNINSMELQGLTEAGAESLTVVRNIEQTRFNLYTVKQLHRIMNGGAEAFYHLLIKNASYSMFILMPVFALLLYTLYRKQKRLYIESLVHSLHLHTFGFLVLAAFLIVSKFHSSIIVPIGLISILIFYFYKSQRKVFNQSHLKTILKTIGIIFLYLISILATMVIGIWTIILIF